MVNLVLPQDFKELLKLFIQKEVKFIVVGGYAVVFHGYPRFTGDIDIWIERSQQNASRLVSALIDFGFVSPNLREEMFIREDSITRMGVEPMKVEIFTHIPGLNFSESYLNSVKSKIEGCGTVPFVSLADLKISKKAAGRLQDLADLEKLP